MMLAIALLLASLLRSTLARPLPPARRIVGIEYCALLTVGYLSGGATFSNPQNFFLWPDTDGVQQLYYGGSDGLEVEFQQCDPNFEDIPQNATLVTGHMYVPYLDACLAADLSTGTPPYTLTAQPCYYSDDSGQVYQQWWMVDGASGVEYLWAGVTDNLGDVEDGNVCPSGTFGYAAGDDTATPSTDGLTQVVCISGADVQAFRIIPE